MDAVNWQRAFDSPARLTRHKPEHDGHVFRDNLLKGLHPCPVCIEPDSGAHVKHKAWLHILPLFLSYFNGGPDPLVSVDPNLCKSPIHTSLALRRTSLDYVTGTIDGRCSGCGAIRCAPCLPLLSPSPQTHLPSSARKWKLILFCLIFNPGQWWHSFIKTTQGAGGWVLLCWLMFNVFLNTSLSILVRHSRMHAHTTHTCTNMHTHTHTQNPLHLFYCLWVGGVSDTSLIHTTVWSRIIFPAVLMPFTQVSTHRHSYSTSTPPPALPTTTRPQTPIRSFAW